MLTAKVHKGGLTIGKLHDVELACGVKVRLSVAQGHFSMVCMENKGEKQQQHLPLLEKCQHFKIKVKRR